MSRSIFPKILLAIATAALVVAGCGGDDSSAEPSETGATAVATEGDPTTTTAAPTTTTSELPEITLPPEPPSDYAGFVAQPTACSAAAPDEIAPMVFDAPEDQSLGTARITALIRTSCGEISVELDPGLAPETVNSFVFLARAGYFDGTVSHRILPGFVLQAGDPTATGREGPGYTISDELPAEGFVYEEGVLAMANSGPNTTGSQFFIMLSDAPLPPAYSVFGVVTDGFETLDVIETIPLGPNAFGEVSVPLETLYIESITIAP